MTVYLLTDGESAPLGVRRTVWRLRSVPVARAALQELLAGPSGRDRREGLTSAIPTGVTIRSFSIAQKPRGSTATIDLAGLPSLSHVSGTTIAQIGTQIARTVIGLSDIRRVRIESSGRTWNFWLMSGGVATRPWDYRLLVGLWSGASRQCRSRSRSVTGNILSGFSERGSAVCRGRAAELVGADEVCSVGILTPLWRRRTLRTRPVFPCIGTHADRQ